MIDCIIFDIDGTLIDTEESIIKALQRLLKERLGKDCSDEELSFVLGIPGTTALEKLGLSHIEGLNDVWNDYIENYYWNCIKVFDGIEAALKTLKENNIKTGIVTSRTREEFDTQFIPFGLAEYMDCVICADDTLHHKPHPEPLLKFLELSGVCPQNSIYVGDTAYDMACAKGANIKFALASWGSRDNSINPDYVLSKPQDIVALCAG